MESLSLGIDAEDTVTEPPTQSLMKSDFHRHFLDRGKRSHSYSRSQSRLGTNETCPEDPADNRVCKDVCTATGEECKWGEMFSNPRHVSIHSTEQVQSFVVLNAVGSGIYVLDELHISV